MSVNGGGSGAGAGRVCANSAKGTPVDIGDMSRDWKATEASRDADGFTMSCLAGDTARQAAQLQVAIDGLSVVMKPGGAAQACVVAMGGLTISQLHWIFSSNTTAEIATIHGESASAVVSNDDGDSTKEWSDLSGDAACLANEIDIAYPDGESGTFEYFCEVALEEVCSFRTGQQSADDNVLVTALVGNGDAIGYFGYAYYVENQDTLTAAPIRNGDGVYVTPTSTTVRDGSYEPLSRPLFMNVHINAASLVKTIPFIVYGLDTHAGQEAVAEVGYVALNDAQLADMMHRRLTVLAVTYTDSDYSLRGELCGQGQTITIRRLVDGETPR